MNHPYSRVPGTRRCPICRLLVPTHLFARGHRLSTPCRNCKRYHHSTRPPPYTPLHKAQKTQNLTSQKST